MLLVTVNVVPSSQILVTLIMEELSSSETSVLTRVTWHNIPEDDILKVSSSYLTRIELILFAELPKNFPSSMQ
jgi:hypothetical protein